MGGCEMVQKSAKKCHLNGHKGDLLKVSTMKILPFDRTREWTFFFRAKQLSFRLMWIHHFLVKCRTNYFDCIKTLPGVNFINILRAHFSYKIELSSFSLVTFGFVIFWIQNIVTKFAHKMLMELTPGVLF